MVSKEELHKRFATIDKDNKILSIVAKQSHNLVSILSPDGTIEWVNQVITDYFDTTIDDIQKNNEHNLFSNLISKDVSSLVKTCIQNNEVVKFDSCIVRNNREIHIRTTLTPVFINYKISHLIAIGTDITKLIENKKKQAEQNEELRRQAESIATQSEELKSINTYLEERQEEILLQKEELNAQQEQQQSYNSELHVQNEKMLQTLEELKIAQSQIVQAERMSSLGLLTAGIAHEINNPVNYINAGIEALTSIMEDLGELLELYTGLDEESDSKDFDKIEALKEELDYDEIINGVELLFNSIQKGADKTAEIIKGLRTFSRMNEGEMEKIDLHEIIDAALIVLNNQYFDKIKIIKQYSSDCSKLDCFPGKLNQMFVNIFKNSINAIDKKGTIVIKTETVTTNNTESLKITIKDSGCGMPEEVLKQIFEPFYSTSQIGKGIGLGLSIVKNIIKKHSGDIEVSSQPGHGTQHIIFLPVNHE